MILTLKKTHKSNILIISYQKVAHLIHYCIEFNEYLTSIVCLVLKYWLGLNCVQTQVQR